jgi:predicted small secreted protein
MHTQQAKKICLSGLLILSLCACQNTFYGVGEDMQNAGKTVSQMSEGKKK